MKLKKLYKIFLLFFVLTTGCVTPIDVDIEQEINVLVIDGFITTENGPHEIRVTRSAKFGDIFVGEIEFITKALVLVRDQTGRVVELIEERPGVYLTPTDFKGEVGSTYTLLVETAAGESYSSFPQTIEEVPEIDEVFFQFRNTPTADPQVNISGLDVFVRLQDPQNEENFYLWEVEGTYRILTRPDLFFDPQFGVTAPKPCCDVCYITDTGVSEDILSDVQFNGNSIVQKVGFLRDDGRRFQDAYEINLRQFSISKEAFEFFRVLRNQLQIQGSIFDPPPATIGSNIINLNDPDSPTIGYFGAFDVKTHQSFVDLSLLTDPAQNATINDDCRLLFNSTVTKPAHWN